MQPLASYNLIAFVAVRDFQLAKQFYVDQLGLKLVHEDGFAIVMDVNGIMLRIVKVQQVSPAPYTVLGWEVPDIHIAARDLQEAGVKLERFPGMEQDELGIWTAPGGGAHVAWFKDPDGNTLSVSQH